MTEEEADLDLPLLTRIMQGEQEALTELFLRYRTPLLHYISQFAPDRGMAEEILQDTFVAVWKHADSFAGRGRVKAWLFGIARRRAYKSLSRQTLPTLDIEELEYAEASAPEPEDTVLAQAAYTELMRTIGTLPVMQREVLLLIFVHELSYQEVASILGIPMGTVKSRLNAARRSLRTLLSSSQEER